MSQFVASLSDRATRITAIDFSCCVSGLVVKNRALLMRRHRHQNIMTQITCKNLRKNLEPREKCDPNSSNMIYVYKRYGTRTCELVDKLANMSDDIGGGVVVVISIAGTLSLLLLDRSRAESLP